MKPLISIVIPVYNEEHVLACTIAKLDTFLNGHAEYDYEIVIANNGSIDRTREIALELHEQYERVSVRHLGEKGRGRAVKEAWAASRADYLSYMDVDLSTDIMAFPHLMGPLIDRTHDLATGSRLLNPKLTNRSLKRETISRAYNFLVKCLFRTRFSDAQCGFKAVTRAAAEKLLPLVEDNSWFMDTELLIIAEKLGYRIFDLPVRWLEDRDSRVRIWKTAFDDVKGLLRVRRSLRGGKYRPYVETAIANKL
jgi:glycosyltransferase involved in cell wall biosynthesis